MISIFDHIKNQPQLVVNKIYGYQSNQNNESSITIYTAPWACKAVFQSLRTSYIFNN
jgi:hypothetical protein